MRAKEVISHIFLANVLVLSTLTGLVALEEHGGYISIFLTCISPFVLGVQLMHIIHSFTE